MTQKDMLSYGLTFLIIFMIFVWSLYKNRFVFADKEANFVYLYIGTAFGVATAALSGIVPLYHLWIAGGMFVAVMYSPYLGIMSIFIMLCVAGICCSYSPEQYVYYEMMGIVFCMLYEFVPEPDDIKRVVQSYIYFLIIGLCSNASLYLVTNRLDYTLYGNAEFVFTLIYTVLMISVVYIIGCFQGRKSREKQEAVDIDRLLANDFELYERIKNEKPQLFRHLIVVADVSKKAAACIGADEKAAMAGGLYHEAGKLMDGDDYFSNNAAIAKEYGFGEHITNIIMSHDLKHELPKSKEAAIVYFTDNIIGTIYYFRSVKKEATLTNEHIVKTFFNKRINDERLYECGLTLGEYGILKQYYIECFGK